MNESNEDPRLRKVLREWPGGAPLPPGFQERVWQRIETAEKNAAPAFSLSAWLGTLFARPAFATACATLLLFGGVSAGYVWAGHDTTHWESRLASHYVASINPYAADHP